MTYQVPTQIDTGYLSVPDFLAQAIVDRIGRECDFSPDVNELFEVPLKWHFKEIRIYNDGNRPKIVDELYNSDIPFHFCYDYQEDMATNYWAKLNTRSEKLTGYDTMIKEEDRPDPTLDIPYLDTLLGEIHALYVLLEKDFEELLNVRNVYVK